MDTETKSRPVRKALAITSFAVLLVLIAWLSITIVKNVPGSFASLASLAESVRSFDVSRTENPDGTQATSPNGSAQNMLVVTSDTNVIENEGDVRLSWTDASEQGSFVFAYNCTDGVAVNIVEDNGVRDINCDINYNLGNTNNVTLNITSEKDRFVDIGYKLGFIKTDSQEPSATAEAVITVINKKVPLTFASSTETEDIEVPETVEEAPKETTPTTIAEPVTETPAPSTSTEGPVEEFTQEFTYTIPVSNPNGRIDLATKFISTGEINNNSFIPGTVASDEAGAVQFEVKNLGTKTSEEWTYSIELPSGGMVNSLDQAPLKPNERAVITIGFPVPGITDYDFVVTIDTTNDNTSLNDQFTQAVTFNN